MLSSARQADGAWHKGSVPRERLATEVTWAEPGLHFGMKKTTNGLLKSQPAGQELSRQRGINPPASAGRVD